MIDFLIGFFSSLLVGSVWFFVGRVCGKREADEQHARGITALLDAVQAEADAITKNGSRDV